jgi:hypothetical protein
MTQSIDLVTKFQPILDEIYQEASVTAPLDGMTKPVDFAGANVVKVFKTSMGGLGDFARGADFPVGEIIGTWESLTLSHSRARQLKVARMDNEESLGMAFGTVAGEFIRTKVAPEVDATRFMNYASKASILTTTGAALSTGADVLAAIDVANAAQDVYEVPTEGKYLFISNACYRALNAAITRILGNESTADRRLKVLDNMTIVPVPAGRFYTHIDFEAGASAAAAGGFSMTSGAKAINFLLIAPVAVLQVKKQELVKIFNPDVVQNSDNWLFDYAIYHDAFVYDNKVKGVYLHKAA